MTQPDDELNLLPSAADLRTMLEVLGITVDDPSEVPEPLPPGREQTLLASVLLAHLAAQLCNHSLDTDPLPDQVRHRIALVATAHVIGEDGTAGLGVASYLTGWARDIVANIAANNPATFGPLTPGPAILNLYTALNTLYVTYRGGGREGLDLALSDTRSALAVLENLGRRSRPDHN